MSALAAPLQLLFIRRIAALAPAAMLHGRGEPGAAWARLPSWHALLENARLRCGAVPGRPVFKLRVAAGGGSAQPGHAVPAPGPPASAPAQHCSLLERVQGGAVSRRGPRWVVERAGPWCCLQARARGRGGGAAGAPAGPRSRTAGALPRWLALLLPPAHPAFLPHLCPALLQRGALAGVGVPAVCPARRSACISWPRGSRCLNLCRHAWAAWRACRVWHAQQHTPCSGGEHGCECVRDNWTGSVPVTGALGQEPLTGYLPTRLHPQRPDHRVPDALGHGLQRHGHLSERLRQ